MDKHEAITLKKQADGTYTMSEADKQKLTANFRANRGTAPREIVDLSGKDFSAAINKMMFEANGARTYDECAKFLMTQNPWFGLASAAIAEHPERSLRDLGIEVEIESA